MQNSCCMKPTPFAVFQKNLRRFLTVISFIVFGLGSLNLAFSILPLILLLSTNAETRRKRIQNTISWHFRVFLGLIQAFRLMTLNISGLEHLKDDKGVIVIANHPTLIDVVVMMAFMPEVDCVIKEGLTRNFFLRGIVRAAGYITNSDPQSLVEGCSQSLKTERNLIIFPEGTRTVSGQNLKFQRGVSHVALHSGCQLRPAYLRCTPVTLSKQQKWYDIPDEPFVFSLQVGELIDTSPWQGCTTSITTRRLTLHLEEHYLKMMPDYLTG